MNLTWVSAAPTEEPVTIGQITYVLRDASAGAASEHKDASFRAVKVNNTTNTSTFGGIADADLVLLSRCLFEDRTPPDKPDRRLLFPVPINIIRGWKNTVVEPLVEHLKKISGMEQTEDLQSLQKQRQILDAKIAVLNGHRENGEQEDADPNPQTSPSGAPGS